MTLRISNITFGFSKEKQILKDLSLSLEKGKIYALMGSNGAGKTTLFNIITGFIKTKQGNIVFSKEDITNRKPYKINQVGIGRTFQDLRLIPKLTVKENILLAIKNYPNDKWIYSIIPKYFFRKRLQILEMKTETIIQDYYLKDVRNSLASEISFGQQKLLNLACCVSNNATLLLLDEAVAGIQPEYQKKIALLIKQLKEQGKTILLTEHNTDFIAEVADKILFLNEGAILTFENIEALRKDKKVFEAYI